MTSAHVIADCDHITVLPVDGIERRGHVLAVDKALDLAILSVSGPYLRHHLVDIVKKSHVGDRLYALGYGVISADPYRPTYFSGTFEGENTLANGNKILVIHAQVPAGTSGAALVDIQGRLAGTIIGRYTAAPERGVAVPVQSIRTFAMKYGFMTPSNEVGSLPTAHQDDVLLNVSALVQCSTK